MLKVYEEKAKKDPDVYLRLAEKGDYVALSAVDVDGFRLDGGNILRIFNGILYLNTGCKVPGIKTDIDGRILVGNEIPS